MALAIMHIMRDGHLVHHRPILIQFAHHPRRTAAPHLEGRDGLSGRQHRACSEHRIFFEYAAIHHDGTQAHERIAPDGAAMEHRHMANQRPFFDDCWRAAHAAFVRIAMDDGAILHIGARADANGVHIAPKHTIIPDAGFWPDFDIADNPAARRDKSRRVNPRRMAVKRNDGDVLHNAFMADRARGINGRQRQCAAAQSALLML